MKRARFRRGPAGGHRPARLVIPALVLLAGLASAPAPAAAQAPVETWRLLVLRVDFPLESPDEPTTSGRGRFDLRPPAAALPEYQLPYDLPPHDRQHYERHLQALARYYDIVSEGRVRIEAEVYPRADTVAYTLPRSALSYGNGRSPEEIGRLWRELATDAVAAAEADPAGPRFADFDSYLFLHAGLGHETGQLNDVRSVYLGPADLAESGGPIPADGGQHSLEDLWILPEAVDDRGRATLNGLLAKFFGHQLGLPGLSNFADGLPAVGGWSLMDVGPNRIGFVRHGTALDFVFGAVPPQPLAWSKARLGWIEPLEVRRDTTVTVVAGDRAPAAGSPARRAVRVPLSPTEYVLLSNRQARARTEHDLPADVEAPFQGLQLTWIEPDEATFSDTLSAAQSDSLAGREAGVWLAVDEYDAFVPGSGVLAWHVDEAVIAAAPEGFNNDRERPGLALMEADGFRDIGNFFFDRQDLTEGTREDALFAGSGPGGIEGTTRMGPDTTPATVTRTGLDSGIRFEVLSPPGDSMRVRIAFGRSAAGWPRPLAGARRVGVHDLDGDGRPEWLAEGAAGLRVFAADGAERLALSGGLLAAAGDGLFFQEGDRLSARAADGTERWSADLIVSATTGLRADALSGTGAGLVAAGISGLAVWDPADGALRFQDTTPALGIAAGDLDGDGDEDLVASGPAGVRAYEGADATQRLSGSVSLAPALGDLDGDGAADLVVVDDDRRLRTDGQDVDLDVTLGAAAVGAPALADLDGDGRLEILVLTAGGLHAFTRGGLRAPGYPAAAPAFHEAGAFRGAPVAADLDGDGAHEVFAAAAIGVYGFDGDGGLLAGFPALTPLAPSGAPALADADGDGAVELAAPTAEGLHVWRPAAWDAAFAAGSAAGWAQAGGTAAGTRAHPALHAAPAGPLAGPLLPPARAYGYPNPVTAADDRAHVRYFLSRDAEVSLKVYDAVGELVERVEAPPTRAAADNEITFSTRGYASGLYLCRLTARGVDGSRGDVTLRLAVSR